MTFIPSDELIMLRIRRMQDQAFFWGYVLGGITASILWWLA
jgi:hypothetical protein